MVYDIVLNGLAKTGKDTFINLVGKAGLGDTFVYNVSSIDPFREIPKLFGWDGEKTDDYRMCLKLLKEASVCIDDFPNRFLLDMRKKVIKDYEDFLENIFIFYHIREPGEILKLKERIPKLITVLLRGKDEIEENFPASDIEVLDYQYDITVENKGNLEDLLATAEHFLKYVKEMK